MYLPAQGAKDGEIKDLENSFAAVYSVALAMLPIVTHKHAEIEKLNRQENKNWWNARFAVLLIQARQPKSM